MTAAIWVQLFTLIGIVLTTGVAILGYVKSRKNGEKIQEVHVLVNSQLTSVVSRVTQLTAALEEHGIEVPEDPADTMQAEPPA